MRIVRANNIPNVESCELCFKVENEILKELGIIDDSFWIIISAKDFPTVSYKTYRVNRTLGYSLLGGAPPKIDPTAEYYISCHAASFENRPVIRRCDGKLYENNVSWIVDSHNLIEIN